MKKSLFALMFVLLSFGVSQAVPMFLDNYLHPLDINAFQQPKDIIGTNPPYEIYGYDWETVNGATQIKIYTDWNHGFNGFDVLYSRLGDVFINLPTGEEIAVAVRNHNLPLGNVIPNEGGLLQGNVFIPTTKLKSDYYYDPVFGIFPSQYYQYGDHEVVTAYGKVIGQAVVTLHYDPQGPKGDNYILIAFPNKIADIGYVSFSQTCANDQMKVPEPASILLFGVGLVGLGIVGRRLRKA